jgi:AcrR family transcriptional regulator
MVLRKQRERGRSSYHHEDLRRALLDAALAHLRNGDVTALTIQGLARAAGVSPGAPYHHFSDKISILAAVAEEGFELWLGQALGLRAKAHNAKDMLEMLVSSWLDFTKTHAPHYRVMFLPDIEDRIRFGSLHATSGKCLALLLEVLSACLPGAPMKTLKVRAVFLWSALHGLASLRSAGVLSNVPGLPKLEVLERATVVQAVASALAEGV